MRRWRAGPRGRKLGDAAILLIIPDVLVAGAFDAEIFKQDEFHHAHFFGVEMTDVDEDHFGFAGDAGERIGEDFGAVDDFDAVFMLDAGEIAGIGRAADAIDAAVKDHAAVEPALGGAFGGEERSEKDVTFNLRAVGFAGDQAMKDGADAANFLDGFVGNVDDSFHEFLVEGLSGPRQVQSRAGRVAFRPPCLDIIDSGRGLRYRSERRTATVGNFSRADGGRADSRCGPRIIPAMDDKQTYLLNGLLARHFSLGRIVRFRKVQRGGQCESFELFTAQEKEYLAAVYPAHFAVETLNRAAEAVNLLDGQRFSVVPFLPAKSGGFVGEGPQNGRLMVSIAPEGSALATEEYTEHDISQVGLRLAWMRRLFGEHLPAVDGEAARKETLDALPRNAGQDPVVGRLVELLQRPAPVGWAHGGIQAAALLHDGDHQLRAIADWGLLHTGCALEDLVDAFIFLATDVKGATAGKRGRALVEAYATLVPLKDADWLAAAAWWCARRSMEAKAGRRHAPARFAEILANPAALAAAIADCFG